MGHPWLQPSSTVAKMRARESDDSMNASPDQAASPNPRRNNRLRFEVIFASLWLAFGLFVLPGLIFAVGVPLLGPYAGNGGLGSFYANYFRDLAEPSGRTWSLVLGPLFLISILRAIFVGVGRPDPDTASQHESSARSAGETVRVEPRIGLD